MRRTFLVACGFCFGMCRSLSRASTNYRRTPRSYITRGRRNSARTKGRNPCHHPLICNQISSSAVLLPKKIADSLLDLVYLHVGHLELRKQLVPSPCTQSLEPKKNRYKRVGALCFFMPARWTVKKEYDCLGVRDFTPLRSRKDVGFRVIDTDLV